MKDEDHAMLEWHRIENLIELLAGTPQFEQLIG
jgi:hypothetical protein